MPEIAPPVPPETFTAKPGETFRLVAAPESENGVPLTFTIDPAARTAAFTDDAADAKLEAAHLAGNFRITDLPEFASPYSVRLAQYWDRKADATIFDVEIGGVRTMICRRSGKYKKASKK